MHAALMITRQGKRRILVALLLLVTFVVFYHSAEFYHTASWNRLTSPLPQTTPLPDPQHTSQLATPEPLNAEPLGAPGAYYSLGPPQSPYCKARFSVEYLEEIRDHGVSYCEPGSRSSLACFHSHSRVNDDNDERQIDSLCVGQGLALDPSSSKFSIHCPLRELTTEELQKGLVPLSNLKVYWYETGPPHIFATGVSFDVSPVQPEHERRAPQMGESIPDGGVDVSGYQAPGSFLLLKREGQGNLWHCLMEIMSAYMTFDVLSMSRDTLRGNRPYFNASEEAENTQVVILDEWSDGPYFDLWTLFARRRPVRLHELLENPTAVQTVKDAKIIVPLSGSSNPLWQGAEIRGCNNAPTVSVFSQRVREHYQVPEPASRQKHDPIRLTFIDRRSRRLRNQTELFRDLANRYPYVHVNLIDFEGMSFPEQIRVVRETDILVGVHGAGLTHTMFMREAAGAMVEIQHDEVNIECFRALAIQRHLPYFRAHAQAIPNDSREDREWHWEDVEMEPDRFFLVMDAAIKSVQSIHPWNFDVDKTT